MTTSAGGIPVMVSHEETALVALVGDPRTLADHGLRLLSEPAFAAKLLRQGHEPLTLHRWSSVLVEWLEVYAAKMS